MRICVVICSSLCSENSCFVIACVSVIGMLTYKSSMSKVIILWCLFIFSFVRSLARDTESLTL
jgi:hypothetical protein